MLSHPLYRKSPVWLQEWLIAIRESIRKIMREDNEFRQLLADAELRQYWTFDQLQAFQEKELGSLLNRAAITVPHYQQLLSQNSSVALEPLKKLTQLPLLTKRDIKANPAAFIASDMPKGPRFSISTSGTTGSPLTLFQTLNSIKRETAFARRQMHWAGYKEGDKLAWIRGDMIVPVADQNPPFWRFNRSANSLMMSSYHLSEKNVSAYLEALREFNPVLIQAYPSSISYLANWLLNNGQQANLSALKGIMTSSETLTNVQREQIETSFGVQVFDWYGSVERVAAIGTCEYGRYHIIEDYSYLELGSSSDDTAEIIGTGFNNALMPLIRYATGDSVELETSGTQCDCKRAFRLVKTIIGRMDDTIKTPDGRAIGRLDHIYKGVFDINEAQIVQETLNTIEIRVVPARNGGLPETTKQQLKLNLQARIGLDMDIHIVKVASLPRTKNGKLLAVISKIK